MILSCYFGYVEAINQSHANVCLPNQEEENANKIKKRRFHPTRRVYGLFQSPLGSGYHGLDDKKKRMLLRMGFPIIESCSTGKLATPDAFDSAAAKFRNIDDESLRSQHVVANVRTGKYVWTVQAIHIAPVATKDDQDQPSYLWWTWTPALSYVGVLCALIGFLSAIIYLIPMCLEYPFSEINVSMGVTLFFVDILQVIPYMCFVVVGHISIAEAAGSWWKPKFDHIGWWVTVFNTLGAYGFLLCGALAIPDTVGSDCCPNMARWGSSLSCFWGSLCYLVGGMLMIIEFANPEPFIVCGGKAEKSNGNKAS